MDFNRLTLLEQKVEVMQREISEVLREIQVATQSTVVTFSTALKVFDARIRELEALNNPIPIRQDEEGKEL